MAGAFVLSMGRSGSTLLSRMLSEHPTILSVSEYWTSLWMQSVGDPRWSGGRYWDLLSTPPAWFATLVERAKEADALPVEFVYDEANGRYDLARCPPILTMTLPALTDAPDALYDELRDIVPTWSRAPVTTHSRHLFDHLATRFERPFWVERSGLSYWYVPDILGGFPDSKYIHLTRDGRDVVLSMMAMRLFDPIVRFGWLLLSVHASGPLQTFMYFKMRAASRRSLLAFTNLERALTGQHLRERPYSLPDRMDFAERLKTYAEFWAHSTRLGLRAIEAIPSAQILTVRYEDLVAEPRETLTEIITFLQPDGDHRAWIDAVEGTPRARPSRWPELDPAIAAPAEATIAPVNALLGYR
ncbi:sulfotransferase [Acuticoccus sp. M5D2P5]|uniref:sulfotransferase family protein n=1 Tax=Acuticoccus kalidii TaxID=2910977 RepID=UPI001F236EF0|nr:sulfotransferase [Acuticoccus kalidii]MCF3933896.1 sulfotransferase [Acuticoccus kalidii]